MAEVANSDAITKKVFDSFIKFRKKSIAWTNYAERAYMTARLLPFKYAE
jgi:TRAP-type mannitol/chloroaromatic compound transport system substrate-binding protein